RSWIKRPRNLIAWLGSCRVKAPMGPPGISPRYAARHAPRAGAALPDLVGNLLGSRLGTVRQHAPSRRARSARREQLPNVGFRAGRSPYLAYSGKEPHHGFRELSASGPSSSLHSHEARRPTSAGPSAGKRPRHRRLAAWTFRRRTSG